MGMRVSAGIVLLVLVQGLAGCGEAPTRPAATQPPPPPPPAPSVQVLVFTDPLTGLQTSDVRDVHGQVVRFNSAEDLIWAADESQFPRFPIAYGYERGAFEVRFGSENGERRAYLTFNQSYWHYDGRPSRVDIDVVDGKLVIRHPDPPVRLPES